MYNITFNGSILNLVHFVSQHYSFTTLGYGEYAQTSLEISELQKGFDVHSVSWVMCLCKKTFRLLCLEFFLEGNDYAAISLVMGNLHSVTSDFKFLNLASLKCAFIIIHHKPLWNMFSDISIQGALPFLMTFLLVSYCINIGIAGLLIKFSTDVTKYNTVSAAMMTLECRHSDKWLLFVSMFLNNIFKSPFWRELFMDWVNREWSRSRLSSFSLKVCCIR